MTAVADRIARTNDPPCKVCPYKNEKGRSGRPLFGILCLIVEATGLYICAFTKYDGDPLPVPTKYVTPNSAKRLRSLDWGLVTRLIALSSEIDVICACVLTCVFV